MTTLSTHVLDIAAGNPAAGMRIDFSIFECGAYRLIKTVVTNQDGRASEPLLAERDMAAGRYELLFHVADYFAQRSATSGEPPFLDTVPVRFGLAHPDQHYHVPLLVSPWSFATYRGS